jgi:glycosyltransferase involved in cell wall biosynthesis
MNYIKDLVSIIIPTFGRADFLKNAINSALNQSYQNVEIIVVDDNGKGSVNQIKTQETINKFSNSQLHYEILPYNQGGSNARNVGASLAKGEYICFLDDDDEFLEKKVELQMNSLRNCGDEYVACYCSHIRHFVETGIQKEYIADYEGNISIPVLKFSVDACSGSSLLLYHHVFDKLNGFSVNLPRFQDYEFLTRLSFEGMISLVKEPSVIINVHSGSNRLKNFKDIEKARKRYLDIVSPYIQKISTKEQKSVFYINNYFLLKEAIRHHQLFHTLKYFLKSGNYTKTMKSLFVDIYTYYKK